MVVTKFMCFYSLCCTVLFAQAAHHCGEQGCEAHVDDSVSLIQLTNSVGKRTPPQQIGEARQPTVLSAIGNEAIEFSGPAAQFQEAKALTGAESEAENPANITVYIAGLTPPPPQAGPPTAAPVMPMMPMMPMMPPMAPPAASPCATTAAPSGQNITIEINGDTGGLAPGAPEPTTIIPMSAFPGYVGGGMGGMAPPMGMPPPMGMAPPVPMGPVAAIDTGVSSVATPVAAPSTAANILPVPQAAPAMVSTGSTAETVVMPIAALEQDSKAAPAMRFRAPGTGNAAALIKAGVTKIATQAAFEGVQSGISKGVQMGVAKEGFGSGGASAASTGSTATASALGSGPTVKTGAPVNGTMNNVTIYVTPHKPDSM